MHPEGCRDAFAVLSASTPRGAAAGVFAARCLDQDYAIETVLRMLTCLAVAPAPGEGDATKAPSCT